MDGGRTAEVGRDNILKTKEAAFRQCNISMDVKLSFTDLEESLDIMRSLKACGRLLYRSRKP